MRAVLVPAHPVVEGVCRGCDELDGRCEWGSGTDGAHPVLDVPWIEGVPDFSGLLDADLAEQWGRAPEGAVPALVTGNATDLLVLEVHPPLAAGRQPPPPAWAQLETVEEVLARVDHIFGDTSAAPRYVTADGGLALVFKGATELDGATFERMHVHSDHRLVYCPTSCALESAPPVPRRLAELLRPGAAHDADLFALDVAAFRARASEYADIVEAAKSRPEPLSANMLAAAIGGKRATTLARIRGAAAHPDCPLIVDETGARPRYASAEA